MSVILYSIILLELSLVTIGDLRKRKIPNYWSLLNFISYSAFIFLFPEDIVFSWWVIGGSFLFLIVGFILFLGKIMGGGDAKFLSSIFLLIPLSVRGIYLDYLLYTTLIFALFFFFRNFLYNFKDIWAYMRSFHLEGAKNFFGTKFPFAPVILITWILIGLNLYSAIL